MSSAATTQFYGLTQYTVNDKPDFADNNQAFRNVDADLHQVVQDSQGFASDIEDLTERVGNLDTDLTNLSNDLDGEKAKITALQNKELSQDTEISRVERNAQDMITAYNEASATSTHAYAVGDYFIYNNVLYQATAAIAVGATIVPDTNCTTTNVTSELIQLNNDLANNGKATYIKSFTALEQTENASILNGYSRVALVLRTTDYRALEIQDINIGLWKQLNRCDITVYQDATYNAAIEITYVGDTLRFNALQINGWEFLDVAIFGIK